MDFKNLKNVIFINMRTKSTLVKISSVFIFLSRIDQSITNLPKFDIKLQSKPCFFNKTYFAFLTQSTTFLKDP